MTVEKELFPLKNVVGSVSFQLKKLAVSGRVIENSAGDSIQAVGYDPQQLRLSLQGIDYLVQTLDEISGFLDGIVPEIEGDAYIDISEPVRRIKLRELSAEIVGKIIPTPDPISSRASGDLDLF